MHGHMIKINYFFQKRTVGRGDVNVYDSSIFPRHVCLLTIEVPVLGVKTNHGSDWSDLIRFVSNLLIGSAWHKNDKTKKCKNLEIMVKMLHFETDFQLSIIKNIKIINN